MTEAVSNFPAYLQQSSQLRTLMDDPTRIKAKDLDRQFLDKLIQTQQSLSTNQILVLSIELPTQTAQEEEDLEGYAGVVADAPNSLKRQLQALLEKRRITIEGYETGQPIAEKLEISIPPDVYPSDYEGGNTSDSRAAVLSGAVRNYLNTQVVRNCYLEFKINRGCFRR